MNWRRGSRRRASATAALSAFCALTLITSAHALPFRLDPTFSGDGKTTTDVSGQNDQGRAVAIQPDGKIVVAGTARTSPDRRFALARYRPNGASDGSFSGDGKVTTDFPGEDDIATAVAIQSDGKIVAAGPSGFPGFRELALARYNPNGTLDTSFSGDGKVTNNYFQSDFGDFGMAIHDDGKIVVVGRTVAEDFAIVRYNPDGTLDTSFSGDGMQDADFGADDEAHAVAIQEDGKFVVAGTSSRNFAVARLDPDGTLDPTFSSDGKTITDFLLYSDDFAADVAIQGDGKIIVAGKSGLAPLYDFALARYNPDGTLDKTFSGDGKITTEFHGVDAANAVAILASGKILAVGETSTTPLTSDFALARYEPNGNLDLTFGIAGRVTTDFFGFNDYAYAVAIQNDGRIVAAGTAVGLSDVDFAVARYKA